MPELCMVVLGPGAVGKSCLSIQYIQGHFVDIYDATIEDIYRKIVSVDGVVDSVTIVDTAGQDAFASMRENYMRSGHAFVLAFSITDAESLIKLKAIYTQLKRVRGEENYTPVVVIGNKADLSGQRVVSPEQGQEFARYAGCHYFEISAREKTEVDEVFSYLIRCTRRGSQSYFPVGGARANASMAAGSTKHPSFIGNGGASKAILGNNNNNEHHQPLHRGRSGTSLSNASKGSGQNPPRPKTGSGASTVASYKSDEYQQQRDFYSNFDYNGENNAAAASSVTVVPKKKEPVVKKGNGFRCVIG